MRGPARIYPGARLTHAWPNIANAYGEGWVGFPPHTRRLMSYPSVPLEKRRHMRKQVNQVRVGRFYGRYRYPVRYPSREGWA